MIWEVFSSTLYDLMCPKPCEMVVIYKYNIGGNNQFLESSLTLSKPKLNPDFMILIYSLRV